MAWSAGAILTAAQLNTYAPQVWTSYTSNLFATSVNPTLGNSTLTAKYAQYGKVVHYRISLTIGSTFTAGTGTYLFLLPQTAVLGMETGVGTAISIAGANRRAYVADLYSTTNILLFKTNVDANLDDTGAGAAWATGHTVGISGTYEAA